MGALNKITRESLTDVICGISPSDNPFGGMRCPKCDKIMNAVSEGMTSREWYYDYYCDACGAIKCQRQEKIES
jgi:predicted RNA-binding Zn-ribbon protein involved in translation (DUF1610 family)